MAAHVEVLPAERGFARLQPENGVKSAARVTSDEAINEAHARLVKTFQSGRTKSYEWREAQLQGLRKLCVENLSAVTTALKADLGKPKMEAFLCEVSAVIMDIDFTLKNLKSWMNPEAVSTPLLQQPGHSAVIREPKGVVLVLSPWNFPVNLSLMAMTAIVASGNCCLLKPSEVVPQTEQFLKEVLPRYLDPDAVNVVTGGIPESTALLKLHWDHIMYTGNGAVARIVARAAAEHLTPVTLELGGKSPTLVLPGANLKVAARRILSGKTMNAGQVCIAPDYLLVHEDVEQPLVQELQRTLKDWYGQDASSSADFGRIVSKNHFQRITSLINSAGGETVLQLGKGDEASKFIPPTLIRGMNSESPIMQEEIFGPVLPILKKKSVDEMVAYINSGDKPLALYIFGPEAEANKVIHATSSGGVCVNDTIFQVSNPCLPFGGVGGSGMGRYHGKWGFDEFSHIRAVMYRGTWLDPAQRYPPYDESNMKIFERIMVGPIIPQSVKRAITMFGTAALAVGAGMMWSRL